MHQFQKSRIILLEELQELVSENLYHEHEFVTHDIRRYNRKLKAMRKTVQEWLKQLVTEEKLQKHHEEKLRKENKAALAVDTNASQ
jgi:hypothetical protein